MHHSRYKTKEYGEVVVNHNGDWSGEAIIHFQDPYRPSAPPRCTSIPCQLLVELGVSVAKDYIVDRINAALEDLS